MEQIDEYYTQSAVTSLKGVGKTYAGALQKQGILNLFDLLLDLPFRYLDETFITSARDAPTDGRYVLMCLRVRSSRTFNANSRGTRLFRVNLEDDTGFVGAVFFNAHPAYTNHFTPNARIMAFGYLRYDNNGFKCLQHPKVTFLKADEPPIVSETLTPVYHSSNGMPQKVITKIVNQGLQKLPSMPLLELIPKELNPFGMSLQDAISYVHNPKGAPDHSVILPYMLDAFKRICFEEITAYQLSMLNLRRINLKRKAVRINFLPSLHEKLLKSLAFTLTNAQKQAFSEICADLQRHTPMLRLLHGDVGSGKTMVALMACLQSAGANLQSVLLAPTELLAEQHYRKFSAILAPLGISCVLLCSSLKTQERTAALAAIKDGSAKIIIGTHSVFQKDVEYKSLALAVIDEQHRFGIGQRVALLKKAPDGCTMHQLVMTATPIPRTQQLALYADLDVSTLGELPSGRTPITTAIVGASRRHEVIERLRVASQSGKQAYWVCPRIEESDEEDDDNTSMASVLEAYKDLSQSLPEIKVGLVHGQMSTKDKNETMASFLQGQISILVATTIIEVGVDVPNASIIVIESADKLGLAQLHQLRGRVGRGSEISFCLLMYDDQNENMTDTAIQRLQIMRSTTDGFKIAAEDLKLRGPGEVFGDKQAGFDAFKVADSVRDQALIPLARTAAEAILEDKKTTAYLIKRWFPESGHIRDEAST